MLMKPAINTLLPISCEVPPSLLPWLTYQDSLTSRLQAKAGNTHLEVLGQRWESPDWWDRQVLDIKDKTVLHREIVMWASKESCWYGRTIIPQITHAAGKDIFDRLKNESLGALIFNENRIKRASLIHYPINAQSIEYHWLTENMHSQAKTLWVRMSTFTIDNAFPFCLIEVMLPGIMRYPN